MYGQGAFQYVFGLCEVVSTHRGRAKGLDPTLSGDMFDRWKSDGGPGLQARVIHFNPYGLELFWLLVRIEEPNDLRDKHDREAIGMNRTHILTSFKIIFCRLER